MVRMPSIPLHRPLRCFIPTFLCAALCILSTVFARATDGGAQENISFYHDVIDTLEVVDSLDDHSSVEMRRSEIQLDPACLYQDVCKHTLATKPLVHTYGPFSAQLSVNGFRPGDIISRVDNVLPLYKRDSYHNLFTLPRTDIFRARLHRRGFPAFDLTTDPREGHGVSLGLLDLSAFTNLRLSSVNCFQLTRISWLDQVMRRWYDEKYSVFPSFEEYFLKIRSNAPAKLGPELNFWFVDQDSYFETSQFDDVIEEGKETYHTGARWKSNSRSAAAWYLHRLLVKDSFITTGWSLSYTRRKDLARGKSGLLSEEPTDLDSHLYFLTLDANAVLEAFTYTSGLEIHHGIIAGRTVNRMKVDSQGMYYPSIYVQQRGDEYTPDELMQVDFRTGAFRYESWIRIKKDISRTSFHLGLNCLYRDRFPLALGPEIGLDYTFGVGKLILAVKRSQRFPVAERAHVTMYPLEGSRVEINDSVNLGFESSLLSFSAFFAKLYDLFDPVDENALFEGEYADGFSTGFECIIKKRISILDVHLGYGYGASYLKREGIGYPSVYDPGRKGICRLHLRFCDSFVLSLSGDCSQGQRITPLLGREETERGYQPIWGQPNSIRLPLSWGVSIGTTVRLSRRFEVSLYANDIPGRKFAVVYDDWHHKNFVKTPWYGGLKVGYDF